MADEANSSVDVNAIIEAAAAELSGANTNALAPSEQKQEQAPPAKTETPSPAEVTPEVPVVEKPNVSEQAERLQRVALQRQQERVARERAETQAREISAQNEQLKTRVQALEARAAAVEAFERDPIEYYEKHGKDPVEFLTRAHKIALNPGTARIERENEELRKRLEAVEKRGDPQETATSVVGTALQQRELETAQQNLVAESENTSEDGSPLYPLFSMLPEETRIAYAQSTARQMKKAGIERFGYDDVCRNLEKYLHTEHEQRNARLTAGKPQPKTPPANPVQAPALAKPTTVTQTQVATDVGNVRELSEAERNVLAEKLISEQFFPRAI